MKKKVIAISLLLFFSACSEVEIEDPDEKISFSDWNDTLFELIGDNDYLSADTLSAWLIANTREAGDYNELINAKTNTAIAYLQRRQTSEGLALLNRNLEIIEEHGTARQKAYALVQKSNFYMTDARNREALEVINEAIRLILKVDHPRTVATVYATKAAIISDRDPAESLRLNYQALHVFQEENDRRNEAISRNNIGLRHHDQKDYPSALAEFEEAIRINTELGRKSELAINYNNISNTLSNMDLKSAAADSMMKAIEINRNLGVSPRLIQNNYNLAQIYIDVEEYERAYDYFLQGYEESQSINFIPGQMYHAAGLARALLNLGRYNEVPGYLAEARELAERLENLSIIGTSWEIEASLMEATGDYRRALTALREEQMYADSLDNIRRENEYEEIRIAYEVDLKDAENEFLRQELSYQEHLSSTQQLVLFLLMAGVLIVIVFLVLIYRSRQKLKKAYEEVEEINKLRASKNKELIALNKELRQLNNDKDQLIGIIVHDLRNPLFGVIGFLEVISETVTDGSEKKHLDMARSSAHRLNALINSLLDVHSLEKDNDYRKIEEVNVDEVIANAVAGFRRSAEKKQITIHTEHSGLTVETHPPYLIRIIDNLVSNAIKFSPSDTRVTVSSREKEDAFWQLVVSDQGPGISEQDKKKMFQMFGKLTARPTGGEDTTGLGLYAVNMLVERLKGSITVDTEIGNGTRFICEFPMQLSDRAHGMKPVAQEEILVS